MSWILKLELQVSNGSIRKGTDYVRSGRVTIDSGSADRIAATVHDYKSFEVDIDVGEEDILAICQCQYSLGGSVCKHIWAGFVAGEEAGLLGRIGAMESPH